ncbi:hypothetical protein SAMN05444320_1138 [Streptoalloteichus hindustanus]|uniref:Tn3 transposase DDE domain-containing protein n=1 Tax=Streptoalloteichus hindustanus TaxID=2017 RepID=A0A1M5M6A1_STRHI|nr:hypothetical protein SAMN05444320_1138 [Streptoalloteichus hindustanus]
MVRSLPDLLGRGQVRDHEMNTNLLVEVWQRLVLTNPALPAGVVNHRAYTFCVLDTRTGRCGTGRCALLRRPGGPVRDAEASAQRGGVEHPLHRPDHAALPAPGEPINNLDAARLSPLVDKHINLHGRYTFGAHIPAPGALRPLRDPAARDPDADQE